MNEHPNPNKYWFYRRSIALVSLACLIITLVAALGDLVKPAQVELVQTLSWVFAALIAAYFGNNAIEGLKSANR